MCGRLFGHGGKSDVKVVLLLCRLAGPIVSRLVLGLCVLWLWRAVRMTLGLVLAGGICTEGLRYGEDAGHLGGLYDDCWGGRGMTTVGGREGHWELNGIVYE
jgi:hypothetical protein